MPAALQTLNQPQARWAGTRPSAVSQALRGLDAQAVEADAPGQTGEALASGCGLFHHRAAGDLARRKKAFALAYEVYRKQGYTPERRSGMLVCPYDLRSDTFVLLAEDQAGQPVATATLVFDGPEGLPCMDAFGAEVRGLRVPGRLFTEVARLAISPRYQHESGVLLRLINYLFIYGAHCGGATDALIEVNPRHAAFYERLLGFRRLGAPRTCPRVCGAPVVLLHLERQVYLSALDSALAARAGGGSTRLRSLYRQFVPPAQEARLAGVLAGQQRVLSGQDLATLREYSACE